MVGAPRLPTALAFAAGLASAWLLYSSLRRRASTWQSALMANNFDEEEEVEVPEVSRGGSSASDA